MTMSEDNEMDLSSNSNKNFWAQVTSCIVSPIWVEEEDFDLKCHIRDFLQKCSGGKIVEMLKSVLTIEEKSALVRAELEPFIQSKAQSVKNLTKIRNEPDFSNDIKIKTRPRGATGAARAPKPDKTPIHCGTPPLPPPSSLFQNLGKTAVLPVLPPKAPLGPISVESAFEMSNNNISLAHEKRIEENSKMCMSFSNVPEEYKGQYVAFFKSKGVRISSDILCDPGATHVVAQKMSRSEKMLGSIAFGKWILHPSYVKACMGAKEILSNFTDFEWGNPDKDFMQEINAKEQQLAKTAFRLRQFISKNPSKGPFTGFRAIIHTSDTRKGAFARLILAGKGIVIENAKPPYTDAKGATHCMAEPKKLPNQKLNFEALAKQRVAVVGPLYINEFLTTDPPPKVEEFLLEVYKSTWNQFRPN